MRHLATVPNITILALLAALPLIGLGSAQAATGVLSTSPAQGAPSQDRDQPVVRRVLQENTGENTGRYFGSLSSDGRFIGFMDRQTGQIGVLELATGESRYLTDPPAAGSVDFLESPPLISPDGELLVFANFAQGFQLSLVGIDGSPPRVLYKNPNGRGSVIPTGWSPDGKTILAVVLSEGTSAMTLISVDDGAFRVLKSLDWGGYVWPFFSPDGRWVAFDFPPDDDSPNRDIFILASDGSRQTTLIEHPADDYLLGWTPDGSAILFGSDRSGTPSWYAVGVADGNGQGEPVLVRPDMWGARGGRGFTEGGTFYYRVGTGRNEVYTATVDLETGALITPPVAVSGRHSVAGNYRPQWSPDGQYLAFVANRSPTERVRSGNLSIVIRSMATGESHVITPNLTYIGTPNWSHDGQSFLIPGTDENGRGGFYRVDRLTGAVTTIARVSRPYWLQRAADGKTVFYSDRWQSEMGVYKHDLESGEVTGLYTTPGGATSEPRAFPREFAFQGMALSPNGRQLALISYFNDAVMVMDTSGGPPRELFRATATADENQSQVGFGMVTWSVDGQHILVTKRSGRSGENELWRVPAEGGEAVKLGSGLPDFRAIHPDGRQILYFVGERESEVWVMENFLPIDGLQTSSARR